MRKKKFVEFCGSDIRSLEKLCTDVPFYKFEDFSESFKTNMGVSATSFATQYKFKDAGFYPLPSYPELTEYIIPEIFPEFELISRSVELTKLVPDPDYAPRSKPLVVHAPSNPEIKGTSYINKAAEKLVQEGLIEYRLITGMKHSEAMKLLKEADIVVDQIISGEYGVLAIEGMALEKPVICYLRPAIESFYNKHFKQLPIINGNIYNIYEVLKSLSQDLRRRIETGKIGREFVINYHDPDKTALKLKEIYLRK